MVDGEVIGAVSVDVADSATFRVAPIWASGTGDDRVWDAALDVSEAELSVVRTDPNEIRVSGIDWGTASLRVTCQAAGFRTYESPAIPVHVHSAEVHGIRLTNGTGWTYDLVGDQEVGAADVQAGWNDQFLISPLDPQSQVIDLPHLGSGFTIRATVEPEGVVDVAVDAEGGWTLGLEAVAVGAASVRLELLRDGVAVFESPEFHVHVYDEVWQAWFPPENAPNGEVTGLVAFGEQLVVTGDFTAIGAMPAPGIASWDGSQWETMPAVPVGTRRVSVDNGTLYATGPWSGFHRWDGDDWEFVLGAPEGSEDALMFNGSPIALVETSRTSRLAWRWEDGEWTSMGRSSRTATSFRYSRLTMGPGQLWAFGTLTRPGTCPSDEFLDVYDGSSWSAGHGLPCGPCDLCGSWVEFIGVAGDDVVLDWGASGTWGTWRGMEILHDGVWIEGPTTPITVRAASRWGDDLLLASPNTLYRLAFGTDLQEIGRTDRDGILVAESFQGAVYLGGRFLSVDGVPSKNIAALVTDRP
ncbi:MAG: hypothetical protein KDA27_26725 [Candidatus Eisenbacteria bacterium]|uniref:Uncharacterized protein n=1 Tax=Eiseniibacteriota bacterium TaxID=2212470 RepID=A0A956NIM6_UNCEI|nr:hypothetical protein [Candidatus Eisenbacteria bacterium]